MGYGPETVHRSASRQAADADAYTSGGLCIYTHQMAALV